MSTVVIGGCNFPNCPRATIYDASARDLRVVLAGDSVSGLAAHHRCEIDGIGVVTLDSHAIVHHLARVTGRAAPLTPPARDPS